MNSKVYKWCAVPQCVNTSIKTPNKLFVYVPHSKTIRYKWLNLARRDPKAINLNSPIYFSEDHFDLPNDMDNFMEYHVMGFVSQVRMKLGCMPTKFECQSDRRKRTLNTSERPYAHKKQRMMIINECLKDLQESTVVTNPLELRETSSESSVVYGDKEHITQEEHKTVDKSIQVYITHKFRSKAIQTEIKFTNQVTSPMKPDRQSVSTSPFKITSCATKAKPTTSKLDIRKFKIDDQSDSDVSYTPSIIQRESSPSTISLQTKSTSDCSELIEDDKKKESSQILEFTLIKISRNPRYYIGVPKNLLMIFLSLQVLLVRYF